MYNFIAIVIYHIILIFQNPRNVGKFDAEDVKAGTVGTGLVGAPVCGDVMKLQVTMGSFISSSI